MNPNKNSVPIVYTNTTRANASTYAQRLDDYYSKPYYQGLGINQDSVWNGRKRLKGYAQMRTSKITIQEEEYKGHQIVVVGFHREFRHYLNPVTFEHVDDYHELINSTIESEPMKSETFVAFGYEISSNLEETNLGWSFQYAVIKGTFETDSFNATMKKAKKRVDLQAKIRDVRDDLISIADERFNIRTTAVSNYSAYNALIGDKVFVHAHGRLRRGVIVDTTGSRFIVGYVTPSNHKELKFKTLPLSQLYVQEQKKV
jgi:hypothetical protein